MPWHVCGSCGRYTYGVGARKVVASHHLHVGLLDEGHPQLVPVAGVGAQQLAIPVHRQEVVYDHLGGDRNEIYLYRHIRDRSTLAY